MRALILGAAGMLGQDLLFALKARGHEVVPAIRAEADVTDPGTLLRVVRGCRPDVICNCAAYTMVDLAESNSCEAYAVNGAGARNVASAAVEIGAHVIHLSTDYLFDGSRVEGYAEWDPIAPLSVYGRSKALGEFQVKSVNPKHTIVRTQWLYGRGGPNFVKTILQLGHDRGEVQVVADQFGSPTYTRDLAEALTALAEDRAYGTYHITNSGTCSWKEFAETIFRLGGLKVRVNPITTNQLARPAIRPLHAVLINQMWLADGRKPLRHYEAALMDYLKQQGE